MLIFLLFLGALNLFLFILSAIILRRRNTRIDIIAHWAFPFGAFVWEDLLVFSLFNFLVFTGIILSRDFRVGLLFFSVFWVVRNLGEVIYWFLQQFSQPTVYPHDQYRSFRWIYKITGEVSNQQCFIIMQVFHEGLLGVFLTLLTLLLLNWVAIDGRF